MAHSASQDDDAITGINVTPLVDIMMVLLIIFMVAARLEEPKSVGVELPRAASGADTPPSTLSILIPKEGDVRIDGRAVSLAELETEIRAAGERSAESQAVLAADKSVPYEKVVAVVDVVRKGGIHKLALSVEEGAE